MKKTEAFKAITTAYTRLRDIESDKDLKKECLSLADYNAAKDIFSELSTPGNAAETFIKSIADFYSRAGFIVQPHGINDRILTEYK